MDTFFWLMMGATLWLALIIRGLFRGRGKDAYATDQVDPYDYYNPNSTRYIGDEI